MLLSLIYVDIYVESSKAGVPANDPRMIEVRRKIGDFAPDLMSGWDDDGNPILKSPQECEERVKELINRKDYSY